MVDYTQRLTGFHFAHSCSFGGQSTLAVTVGVCFTSDPMINGAEAPIFTANMGVNDTLELRYSATSPPPIPTIPPVISQ